MHGLHNRSINEAISDIRLVSDYHDKIARPSQRPDRILHTGKQSEVRNCARGVWFAATNIATVYDPISIEKYGGAHYSGGISWDLMAFHF